MLTQPGVCRIGSSIGPTCSSILRVSMGSARGMSRQSSPGSPMSRVTVRPSTRRARRIPAAVSNTASSRPDASISSQATQREPLPQAPISPPSAFQKRAKASARLDGSMAISWSQPMPRSRSAMARTSAHAGAKAPKGLSVRASTTTKSLPSPFILRNGRFMAAAYRPAGGKNHASRPVTLNGSGVFDRAGGGVERRGDGLDLGLGQWTAPKPVAQRHLQVLHGAQDLRRIAAAIVGRHLGHAGEEGLDRLGLFGQQGLALGRDGIELLSAVALGPDLGVAHVLQEGERRIDDPRAWRIGAADGLLDRLDQFVAVTGLVGDQLEQNQAKIALFEDPIRPPMTAEAARTARPMFRPTETVAGVMSVLKTMHI